MSYGLAMVAWEGHLIREIDAMGGVMVLLQIIQEFGRMLNKKRGSAGPRAQLTEIYTKNIRKSLKNLLLMLWKMR